MKKPNIVPLEATLKIISRKKSKNMIQINLLLTKKIKGK